MAGKPQATIKRSCRCRFVNHQHGDHRTYVQDRCRCRDCRAAHTVHMREYRAGIRKPRRPWLDEIALEKAMHGHPTTLTKAERFEAVRRLTARGYSSAQIADRLGVSQRTIVRKRAAA